MKSVAVIVLFSLAFAYARAQNVTTAGPGPVVNETSTKTPEITTGAIVNSTTTVAPTTASTTPGTTALMPATLPPEPASAKWTVQNGTGNICVIAQLGARFTFNYTNTKNESVQVKYDLPTNQSSKAKSSGSCGTTNATNQILTLSFFDGWTLTFTIQKMEKSKFSVKTIDFKANVTDEYFPNMPTEIKEVRGTLDNQTLFQATVGQSYLCNAEQNFKLEQKRIKFIGLETVDVQLQAFNTDKKSDFGPAQECPADAETSNIVPIAVGAALAGLVLIVLIAYLISRNRSQRGYESV